MATVNRPTDVKQKEADINQKLQLYGIYSGMLDSSIPTRGLPSSMLPSSTGPRSFSSSLHAAVGIENSSLTAVPEQRLQMANFLP